MNVLTEDAAVEIAKREAVDTVLLDLHLSQGTGFGVLRKLKALHMKPCIIVLTNYDLPEYKNAALSLGATFFLDKARDFYDLPKLLEMCQAEH